MTSWIDGSFVYSTSEAWVNAMRSFKNGTFKTAEASKEMPPFNKDRVPLFTAPAPHIMRMSNPERLYRKCSKMRRRPAEILCLFRLQFHFYDTCYFLVTVLGDPMTNQNPAILAIGILFFRYHNRIANKLQKDHPDWSDEEIFQRSRRFVIATIQVGA